ncbi:MAG: hypothetical protein KBT02_00120 [Treponema sp.]|nr:hypothetical protein [Candidatus Treponema caballi]
MSHIHNISHTHKVRGVYNSGGSTPKIPFELRNGTDNWTSDSGGSSIDYSGDSLFGDASGIRKNTGESGNIESRPKNVSIRIWKRTA